MEPFITMDGSTTFYNDEFKDYYHSKSGAREEAMEKYAKALKVDELEEPVIFDMFFGLGYNSAAAIDLIRQKRIKERIIIIAFENDKKILKKILEIKAEFSSFQIIQRFIKRFLEEGIDFYEENNVMLKMMFGDARERIKEMHESADFVFFDPFSPLKVPYLWTKEFVNDVLEVMKPSAKLATYSYSKATRDLFKNVGFKLEKGPKVGRYTPSLIAIRDK